VYSRVNSEPFAGVPTSEQPELDARCNDYDEVLTPSGSVSRQTLAITQKVAAGTVQSGVQTGDIAGALPIHYSKYSAACVSA